MKADKMFLVLFVSLAALAGCAKKDNSFAAKYAKNAMGATAVNADQVGQAMQSAGFTMDIINIRTAARGLPSQASQFDSTIIVDDSMTTQLRITIPSVNTVVSGETKINGRRIVVQGKCANIDCSPYYVVATAYASNGQPSLQVGYKFMSALPSADQDRYHALGPGSITNFDAMVSALGY